MSTTTTSHAPAVPPRLLLDAAECAAWLGVSSGVLDRWVSEGLPCLYTGGGVGHRRFHPELVDAWIRQRMKQPRRGESGDDGPPRVPRKGKGGKAAGKVDGVYRI